MIAAPGDMPVENPVAAKNMAEVNELKAIEFKFNEDMKEYEKLYKKYLEELVTRQNEVNTDVKGKVINYNDGNTISKYYVNSQGVARQFQADAWQGRDKNSCSDPVKTVGGEVLANYQLVQIWELEKPVWTVDLMYQMQEVV